MPYDGTTDTLRIVETVWSGDSFEMELEGVGVRYTANGKRKGHQIQGQVSLGGSPAFTFKGARIQ